MGQITVDQSQAVMSILSTKTRWSEIDFLATGLQESVIRNREETARHFRAFLSNGCRMADVNGFRETGEVAIEIPALPRPTLGQLQKMYPWTESIERDVSPEGPVTLKLGTVFHLDEKFIDSKEFERRLSTLSGALGFQHAWWLMEHGHNYPAFMLFPKDTYFYFPGIVTMSDYAPQCPCLRREDMDIRGGFSWRSPTFDWSPRGRIAIAGR